MTFVFEARRLPFGNTPVSHVEHVESSGGSSVVMDEAHMADLPVWKRRLLPAVMDVVQQHYGGCHSAASPSEAWVLCCKVAMRIVEELPELEMAYNRILECRERERMGIMTAEERMMEELLRERMGEDFLREAPDDCDADGSASSASGSDDNAVDIAMCFSVDGEVLSIGSAGLFSGHGYHPHTHCRQRS